MKPSTRTTLDTLTPGQWVTTHQLLMAGCGSRFGARLAELRALGYVIDAEQVRPGSWRYRRSQSDGPVVGAVSGTGRDSAVESGRSASWRPTPSASSATTLTARSVPLPAGVIPVRAHSRRVHPEPAQAQMVLAI